MDMLAFAAAALGLGLAAHGQPAGGAVLFAGSLTGLATVGGRSPRPPLILPFSFASQFVVLALVAVVVVTLREGPATAASLGFWAYYSACVAVTERRVRYSPLAWVRWRTVVAIERPVVYWSCVVGYFAMAALLLGLAFAHVSGWRP